MKNKSKKEKALKKQGPTEFLNYWEETLGPRWQPIYEKLKAPTQKVDLFPPKKDSTSLNAPNPPAYQLDQASLWVADQISLAENQNFLDLCAAPGGKSLALLYRFGELSNVQWVLNDLSHARLQRLRRVLRERLSRETYSKIRFTRHDGSQWGLYEKSQYDRILLDVPCSGERHIIHTPKELNSWTLARGRFLSKRQYALLCSAWLSLKPQGVLVYSTCTLSAVENDEVIQKFLKKRKDGQIMKVQAPMGEATECGWQIWPDRCEGWGPIYICKLKKSAD